MASRAFTEHKEKRCEATLENALRFEYIPDTILPCDGANAYGQYNSKNESHATSATNAMLKDVIPLRLAMILAVLASMATAGCATTGALSESESTAEFWASPTGVSVAKNDSEVPKGRKSRTARAHAKKSAANSKPPAKASGAGQNPGPVDEDLWERIRQGFRLDVPDNPRVEEARHWFESHPQYLAKLAENAQPFIYLVTQEVEQRDLPLELALLPAIESAYNPSATSPQNAAGIWQFLPGTARVMGLKQNSWYDGRRDVLASTDAALNYLQYLSEQFDGDWHLALAAYNAGEGTIRRAIERNARKGKPTDFWSLDLPAETKRYVPRLLAVSEVVARADELPQPLPALENEPKLEPIELPASINLSTASRACDVPESEIKQYNPALRRGTTGPDGPDKILLPVDDATSCQQALAALAPRERAGWTRHFVLKGESLATIARRHGTSVDTLMASNGFDSAKVKPGTEVLIPDTPAEDNAKFAAAEERAPTHKPKSDPPASGDSETLWRVSQPSRADLTAWGGVDLGDPILPDSKPRLVKVSANAPSRVSYRVQKGDTLYSIARRHNVSVDDLRRWNKLKGNQVNAGQSLSIETTSNLTRL